MHSKLYKSIGFFIKEEENEKMHYPEFYMKFANNIENRKRQVVELLEQIHSKGQTIAGYGASHSTTTLIHHFEIGKYLDFIVDDNPIKHGLYSPVYPSDKLYKDKPEYAFILGWQHRDSIINKNRKYIQEGGKFIIPLPKLKIVND